MAEGCLIHRQVCIMDLRSRSVSLWGEHIPMLTPLMGGPFISYSLAKKKDPAAISGSGAPHSVGKKRDRKEDLKELGSRLPITFMAIS